MGSWLNLAEEKKKKRSPRNTRAECSEGKKKLKACLRKGQRRTKGTKKASQSGGCHGDGPRRFWRWRRPFNPWVIRNAGET